MNRSVITSILISLFISGFAFCWAADAVSITPTPQNLTYKNFNVEINSSWKAVVIKDDIDIYSIAKYLTEELVDRFDLAIGIQLTASAQQTEKSVVFNLVDAKLKEDGYELEVFENRILIAANKPAGIFYGTQTLLQLLKIANGKVIIPAVRISDFPNVKIRGVHILDVDLERVKNQLDLMAKLKMNFVLLHSGKYFELDEADNRRKFEEIFSYARQRFIEPVPDLGIFGAGGSVLKKNPHAAEGIWAEDEHFKFVNNEAVALRPTKYTLVNVIRSEDSNIIVKSLDQTRTYKEGLDYKVIEGAISYPYSSDSRPSKIIRIPTGRIKDGEEVLMSYDYVENKCASWAPWSVPYCPSSEWTYKILFKTLEDVIGALNPRYISIGHDEIRGLNRDSRCKKRNLTNAEILADEINRLNDFVKSIDSNIRLLMWDDMINPWHNGADENLQLQFGGISGKTVDAIDFIPKDIIMMSWWYDAKDWLNKMKNSPNFFGSKGFDYLAAGHKDKKNIEDWAKLIKNKDRCLGIITTTWEGWNKNLEGIKFTAEKAWR